MHQLKPNQWSCSITALAMTLNVPVADLVSQLGHDGSEIVFPSLAEPMCRRGFHSQELIHLAWQHGFTVTAFSLFPAVAPSFGNEPKVTVIFDGSEDNNWARFTDILNATEGILEGDSGKCQHAVHYRHGEIFDPDGGQYDGGQYSYSREACERRGFFANRALAFVRRI